TGVINLRPGGVSAAGALTELPDETIDVGSSSSEASGFVLSSVELGGIQSGYSALVIGSDQHRGTIFVSAPTTFSGNVTLQNTGSGGSLGGIQLNAPLTSAGTVVLASSGDIVQSGLNESPNASITASALLAHVPNSGAEVLLDRSPNLVNTLAVDPPATFRFYNDGPLTIGALSGTGFSAAGNTPTTITVTDSSSFGQFFVYAAGNLTLNRSISTLGPNPSSEPSIELVTGGFLTNNAGAGALSPFGGTRWTVWANTFVGETRGGLDPGNAQPNLYGCAYPGSCVSDVAIPSTGNRFIYEQRPSVTVFADDQLRAFGTANPPLTITAVGLVNGDSPAGALNGALTTSATQFSPLGLYPIDEAIPFASPVGYIVTFDPGRLGVEGLTPPHHGDETAASFGETYIYDRNIGLPPMCVATGPLVVEAGTQGTDLLDVEWSRIRLKPNVTNCVALSEGNTCKSF
ncbi:MAG: MBG domain-containing protein, partial [Rhodocyclaceae bacterium]